MQSSNITNYASEAWKYPQIVVLKSDKLTFNSNRGRFVIPTITPTNQGDVNENIVPKSGTGNVLNKNNLGLTKITTSNYVELTVPKHLFHLVDIKTEPNATKDEGHYTSCNPKHTLIYNEFLKEQKFIAISLDGTGFTMKIIGVYE